MAMVLSWFPFFSTTLLDLGGGLVLKHVVFQAVLRAVEQQWLCGRAGSAWYLAEPYCVDWFHSGIAVSGVSRHIKLLQPL